MASLKNSRVNPFISIRPLRMIAAEDYAEDEYEANIASVLFLTFCIVTPFQTVHESGCHSNDV